MSCAICRRLRVKWPRANLHEHVAHVLHQDKLCLVTRGFEVPIELDGLRLEDCRVVDTLNKKDGRRVRNNEMRGAGKNQIPMIVLAEDLLNAGGREPRCSLREVRWAEHVSNCKQGCSVPSDTVRHRMPSADP